MCFLSKLYYIFVKTYAQTMTTIISVFIEKMKLITLSILRSRQILINTHVRLPQKLNRCIEIALQKM